MSAGRTPKQQADPWASTPSDPQLRAPCADVLVAHAEHRWMRLHVPRHGGRQVNASGDLGEDLTGVLGSAAARLDVSSLVDGSRRIPAEQHGVHVELSTDSVLVAVPGVGAPPDADRSGETAPSAAGKRLGAGSCYPAAGSEPPVVITPTAYRTESEVVAGTEASGWDYADALAAYPPGIPSVRPGERLTAELVELRGRNDAPPGGYVSGAVDPGLEQLRAVCRRGGRGSRGGS